MMDHHLITRCIPLTNTRYPTDNDNGNQATKCNQTSVNRCVEVDERVDRSEDIDVFLTLSMVREPGTDDCKSQGTQWNLDPYSKINDMKSMELNQLEGGN